MSIKECFKSRWEDGYIMEVDFSQLEIVGLAILSGDEVLRDDILSGRDMHRWRAAELWGIPESEVTSKQRTLAKALSFQLQYGAGYKSMAEKNGIPEAVSKQFIENYYSRYERVKEWQDRIAQEVKDSREPTGDHTPAGYPKGRGTHQSATGRFYTFFEYDPYPGSWKKDASFSPTEIKNYPVQGFATADIMALYRGKVYRRLLAEHLHNVLMVNTVHDSVMLDVRGEGMVRYVYGVLEEEAYKLTEELEKLWGIVTDLPLKVECKYGHTWADLKKLEI